MPSILQMRPEDKYIDFFFLILVCFQITHYAITFFLRQFAHIFQQVCEDEITSMKKTKWNIINLVL